MHDQLRYNHVMNKHKLYAVIRLLFAGLALTAIITQLANSTATDRSADDWGHVITMSLIIGLVVAILAWVVCLTTMTAPRIQKGSIRA
ncbi:hypothetical protein FQZ97_946730 [compost metagenome]